MNPNNRSYSDLGPVSPLTDDETEPVLPVHHDRRASPPTWTRRSRDPELASVRPRSRSARDRWLHKLRQHHKTALDTWGQLGAIQKAAILAALVGFAVLGLLFLIYRHAVFATVIRWARRWRELPGGWLILWALTFLVSFPPLIGYSTLVTIAGWVFGLRGWLIIATATTLGSTCSLVVSRTLLRGFVGRLTAQNKKFAALSLVLKHDGLKLLWLIRLCPLPYSLANGAISTIPTVTWPNFMLATALASPKLLIYVFIGWKLGQLAEDDSKMDPRTKVVSYVTILVGALLGVGTGYIVYARTEARAKQLGAEEAAAAIGEEDRGPSYDDDPRERGGISALRRDDDISLHHTYLDEEEGGSNYRDEFTDDEDATEREADVFDVGDDGDERNDSDDAIEQRR